MEEIKLGSKARDIITGFEGIAVAKVEYINGCVQFCLRPKSDPEKHDYPDGHYIDEQQLEFVDEGVLVELKKSTGGSMSNTPGSNYCG